MAGKRRKKTDEVVPAGSLERFEVVKVHRGSLRNAPYNPRLLSDSARAKLKAGIMKHGLVAPPTWNKRTGNICGGHQRVGILDDAYGTEDYEITVAQIDVDDVREREVNILLNNAHAMGDMDLGKLEAMFRDTPEIDIAGTGFDGADLFRLFGASPFEERADDALSEVAQRVRDAREKQAAIRGAVKEREGTHFYLVVIFRDEADRLDFTDSCGLDDNRYCDGRHIRLIAADWIAKRKLVSVEPAAGDSDQAASTATDPAGR
jgi:hypothetical protein